MVRISRVVKVDEARVMMAIRERMGLVTRIGSIRQDRISKVTRVLNNGHFVTTVKKHHLSGYNDAPNCFNYGKLGHIVRDC